MEEIIKKYLESLYIPYTLNIKYDEYSKNLKKIYIKIRTKLIYRGYEISEFTLIHVFYCYNNNDKITVSYLSTLYDLDFYINIKNYIKLINEGEKVPRLIKYEKDRRGRLNKLFLKPFTHAYYDKFTIDYKNKKLVYNKRNNNNMVCIETFQKEKTFYNKKEFKNYVGHLVITITDSLYYTDINDIFGKGIYSSKNDFYIIKSELQEYLTSIIKNSEIFTKNKKLYKNSLL